MRVQESSVVTLEFTLSLANGSVVDTTVGREPLTVLLGRATLLPGFEAALVGLEPGADIRVELAADEAFGARDPELVQRVPRAHVHGAGTLEVGGCFEAEANGCRYLATVLAIETTEVVLDINHPLAGESLSIAAHVVSVRSATEAELEHGHAFDPASSGSLTP